MRFIGDDRIAALLEADTVLDGLEHKGEGLDDHNDDGLAVLQRVCEFFGLGAKPVVNKASACAASYSRLSMPTSKVKRHPLCYRLDAKP